ncbi:MAG: glycosyltransferase family A protein [Patescibacteria group bacterium]
MISIIVPAYQHGNSIKECLDALYAQTYDDFEVIVVNDGSTDHTAAILQAYEHPVRIIYQENSGANIARNRGFREAQGKYLLFCDADVVANPEMLIKMKTALDNDQKAAYSYCDFMWGIKAFKLFPFSSDELRNKNYIHTTSLIRKIYFTGFDESIKRLQDWDLWLTMMEAGHTGTHIPETLFTVKPRKSGMSGWLPSLVYKIPWQKIGIKIKRLESFRIAEEVIKKKHSLF